MNFFGMSRWIDSKDPDFTRGWLQLPSDDSNGCGLTGPIGAKQPHTLPLTNGEIEIFKCLKRAVAFTEILDA